MAFTLLSKIVASIVSCSKIMLWAIFEAIVLVVSCAVKAEDSISVTIIMLFLRFSEIAVNRDYVNAIM